MRRRGQHEDVGHLPQPWRVVRVQLDDHLLGALEEGRGVADAGRQVHPPVAGDLGGLDDGEVDRPEEPLHHGLRDMREVHVHEVEFSGIGQLAHRRRGDVRGPPAHGLGPAQLVVAGRPGRRAAEQLDLECLAGLVQLPARLASARGTALGVPAGVNPPTATIAPLGISDAASSAVSVVKVFPIGMVSTSLEVGGRRSKNERMPSW